MAIELEINGVTYLYPETEDVEWGPNATDWAQAVTLGMLQKASGLFQLLGELDFGTAYGVKSLYLKSRTTGVASAGWLRLAKTDVINWRNNAGDGNLSLGINSSNELEFNGSTFQNAISVTDTSTIDLTFTSDTLSADVIAGSITNTQINNSAAIDYSKLDLAGEILNSDISTSAAIAYSKLALTGSIVNADISNSAAIAYSKLALTGAIVNADIGASAAIAYSKLALTGAIVNADVNASAAIAYSKLALTGNIVNGDINASAAIAYSKLALTGAIVNADISNSAAIAYSKLALTGAIVNADVSASAAIAYSKLALTGAIVNADISNSAAIAYSKLALTGTIVNADVSASAAIAYSKLNLSGSIVNGDINNGAAIAYSKLNLSGTIVNADINGTAGITYGKLTLTDSIVNADVSSTAQIAFSKLSTLVSGNILVGSAGGVATSQAMTGDITISNAGVTAIGANKVTNAQLAQVATATFKGRTSGSTGNVEDLTVTQATAMLNAFVGDSGSGGTKGQVPAPAAGDAAASKFLSAGGTWSVPAGAGDVSGPASSTDSGFVRFNGTTGKVIKNSAATLVNADIDAAAAIAFSKLATLTSANIIVGNGSNVAAAVAVTGDISLTNGGVTAYSGTVPLNKGGTGQTTKAAAFDALSPMDGGGQIIYGGASGTGTKLANGNAGALLQSAGGTSAPAWAMLPYATASHAQDSAWTTTSTAGTYQTYTGDASSTFAVQISNGITVVSTTASSNNTPGITFTSTLAGVYECTVTAAVSDTVTAGTSYLRLNDGSGNMLSECSNQSDIRTAMTMVGLQSVAASATVTFIIQGKRPTGSGTQTLGTGAGATRSLSWSVRWVGPVSP